jgi:hypothetical protein
VMWQLWTRLGNSNSSTDHSHSCRASLCNNKCRVLSCESSGGSFRRNLESANPAQRSSRTTGPPVYIDWNRVHRMATQLSGLRWVKFV